jgi:hypothetical protein
VTSPRILFLAFGDGSAGSNSIVSSLVGRLRKHPLAESWWLTLIEDAQLRIEHALDLKLNELAVFIDTSSIDRRAFEFSEMTSSGSYKILPMDDTLEPSDVLHTVATLGRKGELPASFRLTLPGGTAQAGPSMTNDEAQQSITAAVALLEDLLENADEAYWREKART